VGHSPAEPEERGTEIDVAGKIVEFIEKKAVKGGHARSYSLLSRDRGK